MMVQWLVAASLGGQVTLPAAAQNALVLATEQVSDVSFNSGQLRG